MLGQGTLHIQLTLTRRLMDLTIYIYEKHDGCLIRSRNCSLFTSTCVHPWVLVGFVLLIFFILLYCVFVLCLSSPCVFCAQCYQCLWSPFLIARLVFSNVHLNVVNLVEIWVSRLKNAMLNIRKTNLISCLLIILKQG